MCRFSICLRVCVCVCIVHAFQEVSMRLLRIYTVNQAVALSAFLGVMQRRTLSPTAVAKEQSVQINVLSSSYAERRKQKERGQTAKTHRKAEQKNTIFIVRHNKTGK